ncbi:MAG: hypothetical protein ABI723_22335 [Bacteroidia bacterium]
MSGFQYICQDDGTWAPPGDSCGVSFSVTTEKERGDNKSNLIFKNSKKSLVVFYESKDANKIGIINTSKTWQIVSIQWKGGKKNSSL